ncbi:uncharacterized protein (TIGR04141 family) [Bradyrhizobium sp. USDA 4369]
MENSSSNWPNLAGARQIDQIQDVRNPVRCAELNAWLVNKLKDGDLERIWMAPPTIIDWVDVEGFRYLSKKRADIHPDLDVREFLVSLDGAELNLDLLKSKHIYAISSRTSDVIENWSAFKCLYAEARLNNLVYILNNGKWYEIAANFTQRVLDDFVSIPDSGLQLPHYTADHADEGEYNLAATGAIQRACCLDRKMIPHGGAKSTIEFCDILTADRKLVHVKRYSGSAQLSHLFNQGAVSGELFLSDEDFRQKLNEQLPDGYKIDHRRRPTPGDYEIVFAIISKSNNALDIPFFSKVTMRSARRRLETFGYRVTKKKISILPAA